MKLSKQMTLRQFDHGYWYATEIKKFAQSPGLPSAHKLRKDELEKAIRHFLAHGKVTSPTQRDSTIARPRRSSSEKPGGLIQRSSVAPERVYFLSDFMAANPGATMAAAIRAWKTVKRMDSVKNYRAYDQARRGRRSTS